MIRIREISKSFGNLEVLKGIDLDVASGEIVSIVGPSGAGKTTLLQIMGTLNRPDAGQIWIRNTEISSMDDRKLATFRNREIGFVFQFHNLLPEFTAIENVCIPAFICKTPRAAAMKRAAELLDYLRLTDRMEHKPAELSGGEKQRVAVARALMNNPAVILADEPSGNLDSENQRDLHQLFLRLRDEFHQTFVIVTHDTTLATLSDRVITMRDGRIAVN
ncbi:MAG: ABC transporter ATP-binding protein [Bacteroidales bacterium]|nr:ABC transporter ATP-binding protein [Bacteroidales bacterium]